MIEFPPQISQEEYLKVLLTDPLEKLKAIIEKNNDKYSYWSDVKYQKAPEGISSKELWCCITESKTNHCMEKIWHIHQYNQRHAADVSRV